MAVRFGVVGTGYWARNVHVPGLKATAGVELAGIWGRSPDRVAEIAAAHGVTAYESFDAMLAGVDAVSFAIAPDIQASLAPRAAAAGRHLLLEKPVARSGDDANRVAKAAADNRVSTLVFFMRRFLPAVEALLADAGRQRCRHARIALHYATMTTDTPYRDSGWRNEPDGALWDIGPHALSFLLPVLGAVRDVRVDRDVPAGTVAFSMRHANGASSEVSLTLHAEPGREFLEGRFDTDAGPLLLPFDAIDRPALFSAAAGELVAAIARGDATHRCDAAFGARISRVLECVEASGAQRTVVAVPD